MRSGVTAAGVILILLGLASPVAFSAIGMKVGGSEGAIGGLGLSVLTAGGEDI